LSLAETWLCRLDLGGIKPYKSRSKNHWAS
jgi:hypothetical protein